MPAILGALLLVSFPIDSFLKKKGSLGFRTSIGSSAALVNFIDSTRLVTRAECLLPHLSFIASLLNRRHRYSRDNTMRIESQNRETQCSQHTIADPPVYKKCISKNILADQDSRHSLERVFQWHGCSHSSNRLLACTCCRPPHEYHAS